MFNLLKRSLVLLGVLFKLPPERLSIGDLIFELLRRLDRWPMDRHRLSAQLNEEQSPELSRDSFSGKYGTNL